MEFGFIVQQLEQVHLQLSKIRGEFGAPAQYSISPERINEVFHTFEDLGEQMEAMLGALRANAEAQALGDSDPGILAGFEFAADSPLLIFAQSQDPLSAKLERLEGQFRADFEMVRTLTVELEAAQRNDMELIVSAEAVAREGHFLEAQKMMDGASRLFKGTNYSQVDRLVTQMGKQLQLARYTVDRVKGEIDAELANIKTPNPFQRAQQLTALQRKVDESDKELAAAREFAGEALPDSHFAGEFSAIDADFQAWRQAKSLELLRASESTRKLGTRIIVISVSAVAAIILVSTFVLMVRTGYRVIDPEGKEMTSRFVYPGQRTFTFTLPDHEPLQKTIDVRLGSFTDVGQINRDEFKRSKGKLEVKSQPPGAEFSFRGQGHVNDKGDTGKTPQIFDDIPAGRYVITYRIGELTQPVEVRVEPGQTAMVDTQLQAGNLKFSTDPPGVNVSSKGKEIGVSPVSITGWPPGEHLLDLEIQGYRTSCKITIEAGKTLEDSFRLPRGGFAIKSDPPGAEIRFPQASTLKPGRTPYAADHVFAGTYDVELKYPGLEPLIGQVTVSEGTVAEQTLTFPHGKARITSEPSEGITVVVPGASLEMGAVPLDIPVLAPGKYQATARAENGASLTKEFSVVDAQTTSVHFEFSTGAVRLVTAPPDLGYSILRSKTKGGKTPAEVRLFAGTYIIDFFLGNARLRRTVTIQPGATETVTAQFLDEILKSGKAKLPATRPELFSGDNVIKEGEGLKNAQLFGPVNAALQKFGVPESVRRLPHEELGSVFVLTYEKMGLTMYCDGDRILSLTFYDNRPKAESAAAYREPYWARTAKGVTMGSTLAEVTKLYGKPPGNTLEFDGITFAVTPTENAYVVSQIRIDQLKKDPAQPQAGGGPAKAPENRE
jgi:hypothetical protein